MSQTTVRLFLTAALLLPMTCIAQTATPAPAAQTSAAPLSKDQMKTQKKQQKEQEKAAKSNSKAAKEQSQALKNQDKATDAAEKAQTPK